ncbi:MAG: DNA-binding domain-containing protein, partial [Candidatus Brocadiales bacterium]|nr:DNA-binding domain-containing protein [Candidatus Brocadiales bacterium]
FYTDGTAGYAELKQSKLPAELKLEDPDIAKHFITWIQEGLQERRIQVNNSKSLVHVAKEGALLVTPISFKKFIWENKLNTEGGNLINRLSVFIV